MMFSDIHTAIKSLAENDQSIQQADITRWLDAAISKINQACQCNISLASANSLGVVPEFDERYHDALVLFGVARYRESDADYQGAMYFMNQFDSMLRDMQRDMYIPYTQRVDYNVFAFNYDEEVPTWDLKLPTSAYYGIINVYLVRGGNYLYETLVDPKHYTIDASNNTITFKPTLGLTVDDRIAVSYEANSAFENAPYGNWTW